MRHVMRIIGVALDVLSKAERMTTYEFLGALGVARFEGFDDVHMVADRTVRRPRPSR